MTATSFWEELSSHTQADWKPDPQVAAGKVCSQTSFREKKQGKGVFPVPSVLSSGTQLQEYNLKTASLFITVRLMNANPHWLTKLGDVKAHPLGDSYKSWGARCGNKLFPGIS